MPDLTLKAFATAHGLKYELVKKHAQRGKLKATAGVVSEADGRAYLLDGMPWLHEEAAGVSTQKAPVAMGKQGQAPSSEPRWHEADPPLGRFMLDHLSPHAIDEILQRIDQHKGRGTGG